MRHTPLATIFRHVFAPFTWISPALMAHIWAAVAGLAWAAGLAWYFISTRESLTGTDFRLLILSTALIGIAGYYLPTTVFEVSPRERLRPMHAALGTRFFGRFVVNGDYFKSAARTHAQVTGKPPPRQPVARRIARTVFNERMHWAWMIASLPPFVNACFQGQAMWAIALPLANIPFNVYPILLQRLTRARMLAVQERIQSSNRLAFTI